MSVTIAAMRMHSKCCALISADVLCMWFTVDLYKKMHELMLAYQNSNAFTSYVSYT